MTFIVLGGGGFIGSSVHRALKARDLDGVFVSRSYSEGYNWGETSRIEINQLDVDLVSQYKTIIRGEINLLYMANIPSLISYEMMSADRWTDGIDRMMRTIERISELINTRVRSVGLISSAGTVYGSSKDIKTIESKLNPQSVYGLYHSLAENILNFWCNKNNIDCKIIRVTNPYGKTQIGSKRKGLIVSLLKTFENGKHVELRGNGQQVRDYIYADDLGDSIVDIMEERGSEIRNLSSGYTASGIEVVRAIKKITGKTPLYRLSATEYDYEVRENIVAPQATKTILDRGGYLSLEKGLERLYKAT